MAVGEIEDKAGFVNELQKALIRCGDGRYDFLARRPLRYGTEGQLEWIEQGGEIVANVTGSSLTAIARDIANVL